MTVKRHKSFTTHKDDETQEERDPVTFDIDDETFTCVPEIAGSALLEFVGAADAGTGKVAGKILWFIEQSMEDDEYARFRAYVDDPKRKVEMETLSNVVEYLVEEYTSRPTPARSRSASGRASRGRGSTDDS